MDPVALTPEPATTPLPPTPPVSPASAPAVSTAPVEEARNFLVTFLLTSQFGVLGLRHFYLGDRKMGWIKLGLFVGGYVWMVLMGISSQFALMAIGILAIAVASVWAIVDFFYVYFKVRTDAAGQPLALNARDQKWATVLFWTTIGLIVGGCILGILSASFAENFTNTNTPETQNSSFDYSDYNLETN